MSETLTKSSREAAFTSFTMKRMPDAERTLGFKKRASTVEQDALAFTHRSPVGELGEIIGFTKLRSCLRFVTFLANKIAPSFIFTLFILVAACNPFSRGDSSIDSSFRPGLGVAQDLTITTAMNTPVSAVLPASDPSGAKLSYAIQTQGTLGTVVISDTRTGAFTYTPNLNVSGTDSFTFHVTNSLGVSNAALVVVNISAANNNTAPSASALAFSTAEDVTYTSNGTTRPDLSGTDAEGDALSCSQVAGPTHGSLTVNSDCSFNYVPTANYNGSDSFTFKTNDGTLDSSPATVTITVTAVNDAPVATAILISTAEDTAYTTNGTTRPYLSGTDVEGASLTCTKVADPSHGTVTVNSNCSFTYTPTANYHGSDSFTFNVNDGTLNSSAATVGITVSAVNDAPSASALSFTTNEDTTYTSNGTTRPNLGGTDVDGDTLTCAKATDPSHGAITVNSNCTFSYVPTANYNGSDSFTFTVNDGTATSSAATVSITVTAVNDAPVATASSFTTLKDTTYTSNGTTRPHLNVSDVDGDTLTCTKVSDVAHGALTLNSNCSFSYVPTTNYNGSDAFTFTVSDGTLTSSTTTVSISVSNTNSAPTATTQSISTNEDTAYASNGTTRPHLGGTDSDGDALTCAKVSDPSHGAVVVNSNCSFTYTPTANYNGSDSFTFKVSDGVVDSSAATINISVVAVNDAPVASALSFSTLEDTTYTSNGTTRPNLTGTDVEGDAFTCAKATDPAHGAIAVNSDCTFSYVPTANYNGSDSFTFTLNDGSATSTAATVSITVTAVNDAPLASALSFTTVEDTTYTSNGTTRPNLSGTDVDGDTLTCTKATDPAHGAITVNSDCSFSFVPTANYSGSDSFTFTVNDGTATSSAATVSITVTAVNDAPVATALSFTTNEDTTYTSNGTTRPNLSGTDADGDTLTCAKASDPAHGAITVNSNCTFSFVPTANYNGSDSFTFTVNDGTVTSSAATVSITVNSVNDIPVATALSFITNEDTTYTSNGTTRPNLSGTDADGDTLTCAKATDPSHGAITVNSNCTFSFVPTANYNGSDSFTFTVNDGTASSTAATVSITVTSVNDVPVASALAFTTNEDTTYTSNGTTRPNLSGTDADGDTLTCAKATDPSHGAITVNSDCTFSYVPTANYNGADSFTFTMNDGTATSTAATVSITVTSVNDVPVASALSFTTNEDTTYTSNGTTRPNLSGTDADGDTLTCAKATDPSHGAITVNSNCTFSFVPTANYNGSDSFTFTVNDGTATSTAATVSITVTAVNDAPAATALSFTTNEDTTYTSNGTTRPNLSGTDVDGDTLTCAKASDPSHGAITVNSNCTFSYVPTANYNGSDSFTFTVNDGTVTSSAATVSITVTSVNDTPVATALSFTTNEDTTYTSNGTTRPNLSGTDADGDALTCAKATDPSHGAITVNSNCTFSYVPTANYNGTDSFTFTVNDGTTTSTAATVSITVTAVNDAPTASALSFSTNEDTTYTSNGTTRPNLSGTDVDGDTLTCAKASDPSHGAITVNSNCTFSYVPTANYNGSDSFTFTVNDGTVTSSAATVSITVTSVNDTPVATALSFTTNEDTTYTSNGTTRPNLSGTDSDGDPLTCAKASDPSHGAITVNSNCTFSYVPTANYSGSDSFTFTVNDGTATSTAATVSITVTAINDAPAATALSFTTNEDTTYTSNGTTRPNLAGTDVDGDTLTCAKATDPSHGAITVNSNCTFSYVPTADYNGSDSFTFTVNDGTVTSSAATVSITVTSVNDTPSLTRNNTLTLQAGTAATISAASYLLVSDSDTAATALTYTLTSVPATGALKKSGTPLTNSQTFTQDDIDNSRITYAHTSATSTATDGFNFTVSDGAGGSISSTTFSIVPVVAPQTLTRTSPASTPNTSTSVTVTATGGSVVSGRSVQFYTDSSCSTPVGSAATANGSNVAQLSTTLGTDGAYLFYATVTLNSVTSVCSSTAAAYYLDRAAPGLATSLVLKDPSTSPSNDTTPQLTVSGGGVEAASTVYIYTDSSCATTAKGSALSSGTSVDVTSSALTEGSYTFYAKVVDEAGNASGCSTANRAYVVDLTPPTISIGSPSASSASAATTITYTVTYSGSSSVNLTNSDITLNQTGTASCSVNVTNGTTTTPTVSISSCSGDGTAGFTIKAGTAQDTAGNTALASSASGTFTVTNVLAVSSVYPTSGPTSQAVWNAYYRADGTTLCDGTETAASSCTNSGEKMQVALSGKTCADGWAVTDTDASAGAAVFNWTCANVGGVATYTSSLKSTKFMRDLIDFTTPAFNQRKVIASKSGQTDLTSGLATWWSNTVAALPANSGSGSCANLTGANKIYVLAANRTTRGYMLGSDGVSIVLASGVKLTWDDVSTTCTASVLRTVVEAYQRKFVWVEGIFEAYSFTNSGHEALWLSSVSFSRFPTLEANYGTRAGMYMINSSMNTFGTVSSANTIGSSAPQAGIALTGSTKNIFGDVTTRNSQAKGLYLTSSSTGNTFSSVTANTNATYGLSVDLGSNSNSFGVVATANNLIHGVYLLGATGARLTGVTFSSITSSGHANTTVRYGVYISEVDSSTFGNITATANANGVYIGNATYNTFSDISASGSTTGTNAGAGLYFDLDYSNNTFANVNVSTNNSYGIRFDGATGQAISGLIFTSITANNNKYFNVYSANNTMSGCSFGVFTTNGSETRDGASFTTALTNSTFASVTANNNYLRGFALAGSSATDFSNNTFPDITVSGNRGSDTTGGDVSGGNAAFQVTGVLTGSRFGKMKVTNNNMNGVNYTQASSSASNVVFAGPMLIADNNGEGLRLSGASFDNFIVGPVTTINNYSAANATYRNGIYSSVVKNSIFNSILVSNTAIGLHVLGTTSGTIYNNVVATNNTINGAKLANGGTSASFTQMLMVGNNTTANCASAGTGLTATNCSASGTDGSTTAGGAVLRTARDLTTSFTGAVAGDSVNTSDDASGLATFPSTMSGIQGFDSLGFSTSTFTGMNFFRAWGLAGSVGSAIRGACYNGTGSTSCQIWDWSLAKAVSVVLNKSGDGNTTNNGGTFYSGAAGGGYNTFPASAGTACPTQVDASVAGNILTGPTYTYASISAVPSPNAWLNGPDVGGNTNSACESGESCHQVSLKNARELSAAEISAYGLTASGSADYDGLCERNEVCVYMPNVGAYQGHGDLHGCAFTGGNGVTGVTMYGFDRNGL